MGKKVCAHAGCGVLVDSNVRCCEKHTKQRSREADEGRESAHKRGYSRKWKTARDSFLLKFPLCVHCEQEGVIMEATVVDHIVPHKKDWKLFWDQKNWQPLCKKHHDRKTATEDGGFGRSR